LAKINSKKKFIVINRFTGRDLVEKGIDFWKILPNSAKEAKGICHYYFTNKLCKDGHISPRRKANRECLMCEISPEKMNKKRAYYEENKEEISKIQKINYKESTKDNKDARYNDESPEKRLRDILDGIKTEKNLEEYIKRYDERIEKIIQNIDSNDKFFFGKPCHFGHIGLRVTHGSKNCYKCKLINDLIDYLKNKDIRKIKGCLYYHKLDEESREVLIKKSSARNKNNPKSHEISRQKWLKNNPEKRKEVIKRDVKNHPDRVLHHNRRRRASKKKASPSWLSEEAHIYSKEIHRKSIQKQNRTGVKHEVDHIMPLKHKIKKLGGLCGLDVPWNLEVITRKANRKKGSKLPSPDRYTANEQNRSDMINKNLDTK